MHNQGLTFPSPEATRRLKGVLVPPTPCTDGPLFAAQKEEVLCSGQQAGDQSKPSDLMYPKEPELGEQDRGC